jgi:hypothetical protein
MQVIGSKEIVSGRVQDLADLSHSNCTNHYSSIHRQTQVDAPNHADRATKHDPLIHGHPYKADQADCRPELVPVLHHGPRFVAAFLHNRAPSVLLALLRCVDISHIRQEHECVDERADGLVEQELYQDVDLAGLRLGGLGALLFLAAFRGHGGHPGRKKIFEEGLPYDVGRIADDAEDGKLDDWCDVEGKRCLWYWRVRSDRAFYFSRNCLRYLCRMILPVQEHWKSCSELRPAQSGRPWLKT